MKATSISLLLLASILSGSATRDSNYYGTYANPNAAYSHYWADAPNVLQDLSSFEKLYVKYYGCAWSATTYSGQGNNGNKNNHRELGGGGGGNNKQCGGEGGGEDTWWLGMGQCVGANVAYSLFGVLPGDNLGKHSACNKATFINSFFTMDGLYSFVLASGGAVDTSNVLTYCSSFNDDKDYTMTTGCSASGEFTIDTFYGDGCVGVNYNDTIDTLDDLNANLTESMDCTLIYDSDGSVDFATQLLSYSAACSVDSNYKYFCPDPYGILKRYEYNFAMVQKNNSYTADVSTPEEDEQVAKMASSALLLASGVLLLISSACQRRRNDKEEDEWTADETFVGPQENHGNFVAA